MRKKEKLIVYLLGIIVYIALIYFIPLSEMIDFHPDIGIFVVLFTIGIAIGFLFLSFTE